MLWWLTSDLSNTDGLHHVVFLCDHSTKTRFICINIVIIHIWLSFDNIYCSLQVSTLDSRPQCLCPFTVGTIHMAVDKCVMFLLKCIIPVPIPCFLLTIIVRVLQLSFYIHGLPSHMVRAEKLLLYVEKYCSTIMNTLSLFHRNMCIHVREQL